MNCGLLALVASSADAGRPKANLCRPHSQTPPSPERPAAKRNKLRHVSASGTEAIAGPSAQAEALNDVMDLDAAMAACPAEGAAQPANSVEV